MHLLRAAKRFMWRPRQMSSPQMRFAHAWPSTGMWFGGRLLGNTLTKFLDWSPCMPGEYTDLILVLLLLLEGTLTHSWSVLSKYRYLLLHIVALINCMISLFRKLHSKAMFGNTFDWCYGCWCGWRFVGWNWIVFVRLMGILLSDFVVRVWFTFDDSCYWSKRTRTSLYLVCCRQCWVDWINTV